MFKSHWQECSTVPGKIVQQSLARLFNCPLAQLFHSHEQDFLFFLCWQNSSTVIFTVEESWHVPGIRHTIHHYYTDIHFIFIILVSMSSPRSIYIVFVIYFSFWASLFLSLIIKRHFLEYLLLFWDDTVNEESE